MELGFAAQHMAGILEITETKAIELLSATGGNLEQAMELAF